MTEDHVLVTRGDGFIWLPYKGGSDDAMKCIWNGFLLRNSRDRAPFYLDGFERYQEGGPNAIAGADFLFRMDVKILNAGYEIWLDGVDKNLGEIYPNGLRIVQIACVDLWATRAGNLSAVWSAREQTYKASWRRVYKDWMYFALQQSRLIEIVQSAAIWAEEAEDIKERMRHFVGFMDEAMIENIYDLAYEAHVLEESSNQMLAEYLQ